MSYQRTLISVYGVELSFELARHLHFEICDKVYRKEREVGFPEVLEEWATSPESLGEYYDELQEGKVIYTLFADQTDIHEFFNCCGFSKRQADITDVDKIPSSFDASRDKQYYRYRYYVDFFLKGGDTRGEIRFAENGTTVFGVYIASNGYAYNDDLAHFNQEGQTRYVNNFNIYCRPILEKYNVHTTPVVMEMEQTW